MLRKATQRNMTQQSGSNTTEIWPRGAKFTNQNGGGQQWTLRGGGEQIYSLSPTMTTQLVWIDHFSKKIGCLGWDNSVGWIPHKRQDQANEWCNLTWWIHMCIVWEVCIAMYCSCEHDSKWWSPQHLHGFRIQPGLASTQTYKVRMIIIATYTRTTRIHCINTFQCCTICVHPTENQPGSLQR